MQKFGFFDLRFFYFFRKSLDLNVTSWFMIYSAHRSSVNHHKRGIKVEYNINELAKLAGLSTRTLRYYDIIGLLSPHRNHDNGYRVYTSAEADRLQQILFYRELGMPLEEIKAVLTSDGYDRLTALQGHLASLNSKKAQIELLIATAQKTIVAAKGEITMNDQEKFEGFKQKIVSENETKYGKEVRKKFGDESMDASNAHILSWTQAQYDHAQALSDELNACLKAAFEQGDPAGELAQKTCALHKQWLCLYWKDYSKQTHLGLAQAYVDDPRFKAYYDAIAPGCAQFLHDALAIYCK